MLEGGEAKVNGEKIWVRGKKCKWSEDEDSSLRKLKERWLPVCGIGMDSSV